MDQVLEGAQAVVAFITANAVVLGMVIGSFVVPPVTAVVQNEAWPKQVRTGVAVAVAGVMGAVVAVTSGQVTEVTDVPSLLLTMAAVWAAGEATYQKLWKPTGAARVIEMVTTRVPADPR